MTKLTRLFDDEAGPPVLVEGNERDRDSDRMPRAYLGWNEGAKRLEWVLVESEGNTHGRVADVNAVIAAFDASPELAKELRRLDVEYGSPQ